jgi:hypothetical protein
MVTKLRFHLDYPTDPSSTRTVRAKTVEARSDYLPRPVPIKCCS